MKDLKVGLAFVNDKKMKRLNKTYRGINEPTDVLSFPYNEDLPEGIHFLGEIIINFDEVKSKEEVLRRIMHGARNLLEDFSENSE